MAILSWFRVRASESMISCRQRRARLLVRCAWIAYSGLEEQDVPCIVWNARADGAGDRIPVGGDQDANTWG